MFDLPVVFWILLFVSAIISGITIWMMVTNKPLSVPIEMCVAIMYIEAFVGILGILFCSIFTALKTISPWWFSIPSILLIPFALAIVWLINKAPPPPYVDDKDYL